MEEPSVQHSSANRVAIVIMRFVSVDRFRELVEDQDDVLDDVGEVPYAAGVCPKERDGVNPEVYGVNNQLG